LRTPNLWANVELELVETGPNISGDGRGRR